MDLSKKSTRENGGVRLQAGEEERAWHLRHLRASEGLRRADVGLALECSTTSWASVLVPVGTASPGDDAGQQASSTTLFDRRETEIFRKRTNLRCCAVIVARQEHDSPAIMNGRVLGKDRGCQMIEALHQPSAREGLRDELGRRLSSQFLRGHAVGIGHIDDDPGATRNGQPRR
jgi:hypothetical protein